MTAIDVPGIGGGFGDSGAKIWSDENGGRIEEDAAGLNSIAVGVGGLAPLGPLSQVFGGEEGAAAPSRQSEVWTRGEKVANDGVVLRGYEIGWQFCSSGERQALNCSSDVVEVDEGRETASARRAASRSSQVEVETIGGELESREARKDEASLRRRWHWRAWSRHCAKEAARSSRLAMVGTIGASGSCTAGPCLVERRLKLRRAAVAWRMARASNRPSRSVTMTSVTTSAGGS